MAKIEINAGQTMSAACTSLRKETVDCSRRRSSKMMTIALGDIKRQQAISPEGIADFAGIHPDRDQGRNSEENASCSQPSFGTAYFAGIDGSSLPPQKPMSQRLE